MGLGADLEDPSLLFALTLEPGTRIGSATVVRLSAPRETETQVLEQFELECDCGRSLLRTRTYLRHALRYRRDVACLQCNQEARRGALLERRGKRSEERLRVWRQHGILYGPDFNEVETHEMLAEFELELGELSEWSDDDIELMTHYSWQKWLHALDTDCTGAARPTQQAQWLFPLVGDAGWSCGVCKAPASSVNGCVRCLSAVCSACYRNGLHVCSDWEETWRDELHDEPEALLGRRLQKIFQRQLKRMPHREISRLKANADLIRQRLVEKTEADKKQPFDLDVAPMAHGVFHCGSFCRRTKDGVVYCPACGVVLIRGSFTDESAPEKSTPNAQRPGPLSSFAMVHHLEELET